MRFRKLDRTEHEKTRSLYEQVFSEDDYSFVDYYYRCKASENVIYAAEDETGIHGMVHLNPYTVSWNGSLERINYLVAVATEEAYRHQGIMARLLRQSLTDLYRQEAPFLFLMPASEAIYTPFGFRRSWEWRWEEEVLGYGRKMETKREKWSVLLAEECDQLTLERLCDHVNGALAVCSSLFTWRTPSYYKNLAREQAAQGASLEILFENGRPMSARCQAKEAFPAMMARIVHLGYYLSQVRTREKRQEIWQITDGLIEENNGTFAVTLTPGGGRLRRLANLHDWEKYAGNGALSSKALLEREGAKECFLEREREPVPVKKVDIADIPQLLGEDDPFRGAVICEVV